MKITKCVMETVLNDARSFVEYFQGVWTDWQSKVVGCVLAFFGISHAGFYGDPVVLYILIKLMLIDLGVGIWDAVKTKTWNLSTFLVKGVVKFPVYGLYIFLVASSDSAIEHTMDAVFDYDFPLLEFFITYLIVAEVYSICRHLHYIGFRIPSVLLWFCFGFKDKLEKRMKQFVDQSDKNVQEVIQQMDKEKEQ